MVMSGGDKIPTMSLKARFSRDDGQQISWDVTFVFKGSNGDRNLGNNASGLCQVGTNDVHFTYGPAVHDAERACWTTMNSTDRPDVRKRIVQLVINAKGHLIRACRYLMDSQISESVIHGKPS